MTLANHGSPGERRLLLNNSVDMRAESSIANFQKILMKEMSVSL